MKLNTHKAQKIIKWLLGVQVVWAFGWVIFFVIFSGPLIIGQGRFNEVVSTIETINYRLWLGGLSFLYLIIAISLFITFFLVDISSWQMDEVKSYILNLFRGKVVPVKVDIDEVIPVSMDKPVTAPFSVETKMDFNEKVHVKATIPVNLDLPIDTVVETKVLGIGSVKIPIKTTLPVNMEFPFEGEVKMHVENFNLKLNEMAQVELPTIEVPIKCGVEAKLNIEANLQNMEEFLKNKKKS